MYMYMCLWMNKYLYIYIYTVRFVLFCVLLFVLAFMYHVYSRKIRCGWMKSGSNLLFDQHISFFHYQFYSYLSYTFVVYLHTIMYQFDSPSCFHLLLLQWFRWRRTSCVAITSYYSLSMHWYAWIVNFVYIFNFRIRIHYHNIYF